MPATDPTPRSTVSQWQLGCVLLASSNAYAIGQKMRNDRMVHIVNDGVLVSWSLAHVLHEAGFETNTYNSARAFLAIAAKRLGGCALVDIRTDGFEILTHLNDMRIHLPVVVITPRGDVATAVRTMKAGAVDVIEKPYSRKIVVSAIERALARPAELRRECEAESAAALIAELSPREHEVLQALMTGHSNKRIAFDLGISVRTVEVHRARMMERLGTRQLAEAVRLAVLAKFAGG
jgi:two-component system, LuxR family, response regulator FixJ